MDEGSQHARRFYDEKGWNVSSGDTVDRNLFGTTEDGPVRIELHQLGLAHIQHALSQAGTDLNLLECGCGGQPERNILGLCSRYTGVDFSITGLQLAKASLTDASIPIEFMNADACALPFADETFDAVYSAHMIYHIDNIKAQEAALTELIRVVRPKGIVVLITANPRPFLFPIRFLKRLLADAPIAGSALNRIRPKPPLPYKPMTIGWTREVLQRRAKVKVAVSSLPSTWFFRHVSEHKGIGKYAWRALRWLTRECPVLSAYLGNYVMIVCSKSLTSIS